MTNGRYAFVGDREQSVIATVSCCVWCSIPALLAVWLAARCRGSRMVIDWHNFGFTVLAHSLGPSHIFVSIARWYERCFAGLADSHICVTNAMRLWLEQNWGIRYVKEAG